MQTFTSFFGGPFFGGEFFSVTPNVGGGSGGIGGSAAAVYLRGGKRRTSTDIMLDRRRFGMDETLERTLEMWGYKKKK